MKKTLWMAFFLLSLSFNAWPQEKERSLALRPDVHFRTFWMNTSYTQGEYKDDYALGMSLNLGATLSYRTDWKLQIGYRTFANVASSDIWNPDPVSGQANRYETGLFDLLDPRDRLFGKLETLSLAYSTTKLGIKVGRMGINSDWVNAQDGRLSPTVVEGVNAWFAPDSKWKFSLWGIGRMSIRGSSEWFSVGKTVGIYPTGRSVSGKPAQYFDNTSSDWMGIWEVDRLVGKDAKIHFSNTLAQNLFSTYLLSAEKNKKVASGIWTVGIQTGYQHSLGDGGNSNPELAYKMPGDRNYALSGRIAWKNSKWIAQLNYTHVGGKGRWLSPREWGKDAWYTFIPRERNEGFETVDALVGYGEYRFEKIQLTLYAHLGIHWLPDTSNAPANKYNFASYGQGNLGMKYQPRNVKNLDFHLILMNKEPLGAQSLNPNQIYNKVNLVHFNAIVNWRWN
jgi:hypothetical protein